MASHAERCPLVLRLTPGIWLQQLTSESELFYIASFKQTVDLRPKRRVCGRPLYGTIEGPGLVHQEPAVKVYTPGLPLVIHPTNGG